ncbi:putative transmembrane protein [Apostichopus japonicus]|uniref:Putative transmembrane protein n=1 Tax=Stichopus japonicus TaxID=307972 RepID=A0A2G8JZA1_STIJA|nr:putative transmembrane protein [Apostichopus japonicus]
MDDKSVGFRTVDPRRPRVPSAPPSLRTTPVKAGIKPSSTYIYSTPPVFQSGMGSSVYGSVSPASQSYNMSRASPGNLSQSSTPQGGVTMNMSNNMSYQTPSPHNHSNSPFLGRDGINSFGGSGSLLRSRHQTPPTVNRSPLSTEDTISDMNSLNNYLKAHEDRRTLIGSTESSPSGSPSFFSYNRSASDFTYLLGRQQYQLASRSPQSPSLRKDDDPDYPAKYSALESWLKVNVNRDELERWIANLRNWLSQAIFAPIVKQIHFLNKELHRVGHGEVQIGESSIASLKQVAILKSGQLPTLNQLIPYLELSSNQEYVVQRIKDLGGGGYIKDFRWDRGGDYKGKKWDKELPSDSALVMHMFCTFMDSQLPPDPKYPDGKTFTTRYFMKTPDKPDLKKDNILMFQTKITPAHYKIILGDDTWDLAKGRSNMFQAILFFLHHIRSKHNGMLGRVNLGPAGINLLALIKDDLQQLLE